MTDPQTTLPTHCVRPELCSQRGQCFEWLSGAQGCVKWTEQEKEAVQAQTTEAERAPLTRTEWDAITADTALYRTLVSLASSADDDATRGDVRAELRRRLKGEIA